MSDYIPGEKTKRYSGRNCGERAKRFSDVLNRMTHGAGQYIGEYFNGNADPPYIDVYYAETEVLNC